MLRCAAASQVVRRGDGDLAQIRTQSHGDHVLLDDLADPDSGVEAARDEVHHFIIHRDVENDIRIGFVEGLQNRSHINFRSGPEAVNANRSDRLLAQMARLADRGAQLLNRGPHSLQKPIACLGQGHIPRVSMQEPYAHALLQRAHELAERR